MSVEGEQAAVAALAYRVVADVLGGAARVVQVQVLQTGPTAAVLAVRLEQPPHRLVLKLVALQERPGLDLERTAVAADWARSAGVPVPEVLAADASGRLPGWQYLLQHHVSAPAWHEVRPTLIRAEADRAHGLIAGLLLALRGLPLAGFGELGQLRGPTGDDLVEALRLRVRLRVRRPAARAVAEALLERCPALLDVEQDPVLSHDDLHHKNLLVSLGPDGWRPAAVLDWDKAWAGPAEADLARVAFWDDMTGPGFWSVYRDAVPRSDGEDERLAAHQLLWCLEYDAPTARHRADTEALTRRFGLAPPVG